VSLVVAQELISGTIATSSMDHRVCLLRHILHHPLVNTQHVGRLIING